MKIKSGKRMVYSKSYSTKKKAKAAQARTRGAKGIVKS